MKTAGLTLGAALLLLAPAVPALTPPPPQPDRELLPLFYATFDGDNWQRNDGWLDPEVHWCDWYGVTCGDEFWPGLFAFEALELPANNLSGEMSEPLAWLLFRHVAPRLRLDLAENAISGELHHFPVWTRRVDISDNRLEGALPALENGYNDPDEKTLLLARNSLEGTVPESWQNLSLRRLDLADNRLEAGALNAFKAMSRHSRGFLDLAGNRFSSELTTAIFPANLNPSDLGNVGGGLRLCFNDFSISREDIFQWVAGRHAGGPDFDRCLARERSDIDLTLSGSWFNPERDGEGVSLQLLENGAPLLYSFGFDRQGRQQWLFEIGRSGERFLRWPRLLETRGDFGQGLRFDGDHPLMRGMTRMRFDRIGVDALHVERNYYDLAACGALVQADPDRPPSMPCPPPLLADRLDYQRLTELAGTSCDNQNAGQVYSGAWYNPQADGEGLIIEVLPDDRAVVYWFTYAADGSGEQAWMTGWAPLSPSGMTFDSLVQPVGASYGPDFDPDDVERIDWGELRIEFHDNESGHVYFESQLENFGSGDYPIEKLTGPMLAECD